MSVIKEAWSADPDNENRDPNNLNDHLKISFEETIGEPDHTHSIDCIWKFSFKCFNLWKTLCYIILSTLCGIPHAIIWGCAFAIIAFEHIWHITPCLRCYDIQAAIVRKLLTIYAQACIAPWCEAIGSLFAVFKK